MKEKLKKQSKEVNLFTFLNQINNKKRDVPFDKNKAPKILLCYWLSQDPNLISIVNEVNHRLFDLDDELVYEYFMHSVPKSNRYLKWTKKNGEKDRNSKIESKLAEKFNISKREARQIMYNGGVV